MVSLGENFSSFLPHPFASQPELWDCARLKHWALVYATNLCQYNSVTQGNPHPGAMRLYRASAQCRQQYVNGKASPIDPAIASWGGGVLRYSIGSVFTKHYSGAAAPGQLCGCSSGSVDEL